MTTENKSIWHPGTHLPDEEYDIVFFSDGLKVGYYSHFDKAYKGPEKHYGGIVVDKPYYFPEDVKEWAYIDDLVSASKALNLALECMQKCKTRDHIGAICRTPEFVEEYERKISEIMKGDK